MELKVLSSCLIEDACFEVVWCAVQCPGLQRVGLPSFVKDVDGAEWLGLLSATVVSRQATVFTIKVLIVVIIITI
jgi:hypothetical protein